MARWFLRFANGLLSCILTIALLIMAAYSGYALWDNRQIYQAASDVQADMIKLKPVISEEEDAAPSFAELLAINPDVCAWVTMDETKIDYPVLQGETNLTYINTDVYGNFALAGSIFLDSRCERDFSDNYSLLYGHHMEDSRMFGDLDKYKDAEFFEKNRTGMLILPDRICSLTTFACLLVTASDDMIFDPDRWQDNIEELLDYAQKNALNSSEETIEELRQLCEDEDAETPQILALSTCSSEFTDARTIVLCVMNKYVASELGEDDW